MQRSISIFVCHVDILVKRALSLTYAAKVSLDDLACKLEFSLGEGDVQRQTILDAVNIGLRLR